MWLAVAAGQLRSAHLAVRDPFRRWHEMMVRWDASYYRAIATTGYPSQLPIDSHGAVTQNVWAFFPAFPFAARLLAAITGLSFETAGVVFNLAAGAVAALCLAELARIAADETTALWTVVLWSLFPTAFVLQVPYSEALYLALASGCLVALVKRRYGVAALLLFVAALTRGHALALAVASIVAARSAIRDRETRNTTAIVLLIVALVAPFEMMAFAAAATGRTDAYAATQRAWGYSLDPIEWVRRWPILLAHIGPVDVACLAGLALVAGAAIVAIVRRSLPATLRIYTVAATVLVAATSLPGAVAYTSVPRFAFGIVTMPLMIALAVRSLAVRIGIAVVFAGLQYLWILNIWSGRVGVAP